MIEALGPADLPTQGHRAQTIAHLAGMRIDQGRIEEAADMLAPFEDRVTSCAPLARVHLRRGDADLAVAVLRRGLNELFADALRSGLGDTPATVDDDIVAASLVAEDVFHSTSFSPNLVPTLLQLAALEPTTLAVMHGASFRGDGATQLCALAAGYAARAADAA